MNNTLTKTEVLNLLNSAYGFVGICGVLCRVGQISDDYFELESGDDWMAFHYTGATLVDGTATFKPRNSMYLDKVSFTVMVVATEGPKADLVRERDEALQTLRHIELYGTHEINAAARLRDELAKVLVERDETLRKLDDAERELADLRMEALELVNLLPFLSCSNFHHRDTDLHGDSDKCPVAERFNGKLNQFLIQIGAVCEQSH